jgi:integrase
MPSQRQIEAAKPGRVYYGEGLCLIVNPDGRRRWIFRFTSPLTHRVSETSIGPYPVFSYQQARDAILEMRRQLAQGQDPVQVKREKRGSLVTFAQASDTWINTFKAPWSESQMYNAHLLLKKHGAMLATKMVANIDKDTIEQGIKPLMIERPKQARRTLAMWARVLDLAINKGWRTSANPAEWRGCMEHRFPDLPKNGNHHEALDYAQVPEFMKRLRLLRSTSASCLECIILCACRTGEIRRMQWSEINWEQRTLVIPAERMKTRVQHIIPLSDRVLELLQQQKQYSTSEQYVFTGRASRPLDEKAMGSVLRHMGESVTVHGFRSTFRNWAAEQTAFDFYAVEMCLAHFVGSAVTRAYLRGNALEKRRGIMAAWASCCGSAASGQRLEATPFGRTSGLP